MNAYKKFAYYYDEVMASMDYDLWLEFIEPYLKENSLILDLACGTGTLAIMLKLKGYESEGLDLSTEVIEIANEKAKINHLHIPFYVQDMIHFHLDKKYDMITCFFDSINFLKNEQEIQQLLKCVHKHLKPNGLFVFDIFSKELFDEYANNEMMEETQTYQIQWKTKKVSPTSIQHHIAIQEGDYIFEETYEEYYYKLKSLNLDQFKLLKISGDFNDDYQPGDERILIVLQVL